MTRSHRNSACLLACMVTLALFGNSNQTATADEMGTAEEAKEMLQRAISAVNADEEAALAAFTAGSEGFKDRDLYVFCGDAATGLMTAHGANSALVGKSLREITDKTGKPIGEEFYAVASEGEFSVVEYMWPRPGETEPSPKASYVSKAGGQICGVGYYQ